MWRRLGAAAVLCLPLVLTAQEKLAREDWSLVRSGPFEVLSDAGAKSAQEVLGELEQFRHALGSVLGQEDVQPVWPIRVVILRNAKEASAYSQPQPLTLGRDSWYSVALGASELPPAWYRQATEILIDSNASRTPAPLKRGLITLFSTIRIDRTYVTLGTPPPVAGRTRDWALVHMLTVLPDYSGKVRVLMRNLQTMPDQEPAYRNAFGKTPEETQKAAEAYLAAGKFGTRLVSGLAVAPFRDFYPRPVPVERMEVILADLLAANPAHAGDAARAYEATAARGVSAEAEEGAGLIELQEGNKEAALKRLTAATKADSKSARAWVELARLTTDQDQAMTQLRRAAALNPRWSEPWLEMAKRAAGPVGRAAALESAAKLSSGNAEYWKAAALAHIEAEEYAAAEKAWMEAEKSSATEQQRCEFMEARLQIGKQKVDAEEAERNRKKQAELAETERVRQESLARIRAFEQKANSGDAPLNPHTKVEVLWGGKQPDKRVAGTLHRIDCRGKTYILTVVAEDKSETRLLVTDVLNVMLDGGELQFHCGPQKGETVAIEYFPRKDPKTGTAGEAAIIHIQ